MLVLLMVLLLAIIVKQKLAGQASNNDITAFEIIVPLKYLRYFWRTSETPLINCEIDFILTWSANCVKASHTSANQATTFAITDVEYLWNFMFQMKLYQLMIMQIYHNSWSQDLNAQLTRINIKQKHEYRHEISI